MQLNAFRNGLLAENCQLMITAGKIKHFENDSFFA